MIFAISSSVTFSCTSERSLVLSFSSSSSNCFCNCGRTPYCNSAALFRSYVCCACFISFLVLSIFSRSWLTRSTASFSVLHCAFFVLNSSLSSASSFCRLARRSWLSRSVSFFKAVSSISSCITLRFNSSSSAGIESNSVLIIAQASSTRSIALSGRKRSEI